MNYGFIYCLGNQAMPGIYKIGMTERAPSQRCLELSNSTSAPLPFDLLFYGEVANPQAVEREIHDYFSLQRVNDSREFFRGYAHEFHEALSGWCNSVCTTSDGGYYLSVEDIVVGMTLAESDERRVELFCQFARQEGIVMWNDQGVVRFNVPSLEMILRWIVMVAATSKSILLKHLPAEFIGRPKLVLAASNPEVVA